MKYNDLIYCILCKKKTVTTVTEFNNEIEYKCNDCGNICDALIIKDKTNETINNNNLV